MIGMLRQEAFGRRDKRCDGGFHVGCAATIKHAISHRGLEGIRMPLVQRARWNDVGMAGETYQGFGAPAACPEIIDVAEAQVLDGETEPGQAFRQ